MTEHIINISRDEAFLARLGEYRAPDEQDRRDAYQVKIECPTPENCIGWDECHEPHTSPDGFLGADDGPYDSVCSCAEAESTSCTTPWCGRDDFEFHGVEHTWRDSWGWTVPFEGCIVAAYEIEVPDGIDTTRDGRWLIEDDWDDTDCYLVLVREMTGGDDEH